MDTIFMNSGNIKTSEPCRLLLNLADKTNLRRSDKYVVLSNLSMYYTWKRKSHKNNKFKTKARTWNKKLIYLMDRILYQIFKIILNIS